MPFDAEEADKAVRFFSKISHTKGEWAGRQFELEPWQTDEVVRPLFGTVNEEGRRQYRTAIIGIPRKNGKSSLGAGLALKLLMADGEPGAEVYSAAADREQAAIVFGMAKEMIQSSPALQSRHPKIYRSVIEIPHTGSIYRVLSADAFTKHGLSPHGVVFDELHAQPNRELWDVLTTGQGARRQPLTIAITTAGSDINSICYELYDYGSKVQQGVLEDPTFFFRWWGAKYEDDYTDEAVWARANPNLGVSVSVEFLRAEMRQAQQSPGRQNAIRQLYLNQWVRQTTRWIDMHLWDENAGIVVEEQLAGKVCYAGLDMASTEDVAAWVMFFPDGIKEPDGTTSDAVLARFWLPEAAVTRRKDLRDQLKAWAAEGFLEITPGAVIDHDAIKQRIDGDMKTFKVQALGYDRWNSTEITTWVRKRKGDKWAQDVPQSVAHLNAPSKELERLLGLRRLRHGGHPVLRWMADNVQASRDAAGNLKPDRGKSKEKIDGILALTDALAVFLKKAPQSFAFVLDLDAS